jgi:plastocyanin
MKTTVASRSTVMLASLLGLALIAGCSLLPIASDSGPGPMGGSGPGPMGGSMMGGFRPAAGQAGPGQAGFLAGTPAAPRLVSIVAGPGETFSPSEVDIAPGETVTFAVTAVGPTPHEFKVGPAAVVAADGDTPEIADIGMMQTKSLTYTFDGPGPFAYACHEPGHFEAGMRGTITLVG